MSTGSRFTTCVFLFCDAPMGHERRIADQEDGRCLSDLGSGALPTPRGHKGYDEIATGQAEQGAVQGEEHASHQLVDSVEPSGPQESQRGLLAPPRHKQSTGSKCRRVRLQQAMPCGQWTWQVAPLQTQCWVLGPF